MSDVADNACRLICRALCSAASLCQGQLSRSPRPLKAHVSSCLLQRSCQHRRAKTEKPKHSPQNGARAQRPLSTEQKHLSTEQKHLSAEEIHLSTEEKNHSTEEKHLSTEEKHLCTEENHLSTEEKRLSTEEKHLSRPLGRASTGYASPLEQMTKTRNKSTSPGLEGARSDEATQRAVTAMYSERSPDSPVNSTQEAPTSQVDTPPTQISPAQHSPQVPNCPGEHSPRASTPWQRGSALSPAKL